MRVEQGRKVRRRAIEIANEIHNLLLEIENTFGIKSGYDIYLVPKKRRTVLKVEIKNSSALSSALPPEVTGSPQRIRKIVISPLASIVAL